MKSEKIDVSEVMHCDAHTLYNAWLDSKEHSAFTGSTAQFHHQLGAPFMAWDGYISGEILELEADTRILQSWRATDFPEDADDSLLEVIFENVKQGCKITILHWNLPKGMLLAYTEGWQEYYFKPMKLYFNK